VAPEVDVWWATLAQYRPDQLDLLGEVERQRRERFRREEDRIRFTVGVAVLRRAVAGTLGVPVADVAIDRTCPTCDEPHGRPRLPSGELHLSVSHSGVWVAVAVTAAAPVGVDVEQVRPIDIASMTSLVLAPQERAETLAEFYTHWTRKESVVKATGDGLRTSMAGVVVDPGGRVTAYPDRPDLVATAVDLARRDGYVAALTVLSATRPRVHERDAAPLLAPPAPPTRPRC
jgi:4'-phosphopantetheinyl transferase